MAAKSIATPVGQTIPDRVPLQNYESSIWEVADMLFEELGQLGGVLSCIVKLAEDRDAPLATLKHIGAMAKTIEYCTSDWHNLHDSQIAACKLDSMDPAIRAEARP